MNYIQDEVTLRIYRPPGGIEISEEEDERISKVIEAAIPDLCAALKRRLAAVGFGCLEVVNWTGEDGGDEEDDTGPEEE